jgi:hypothetical protein
MAAPMAAPPTRAETADLELRTLPDSVDHGTKDYYLGMTSQQHFWMHPDMAEHEPEPRFDSVAKKEPKYRSEHPFKRVAKLGSYQYAFALDSTNLEKQGYDRLYLDRNRNGDLTDDKVINAKRMDAIFGGSYRQREFPSQKLEVEADGKTFETPCSLSVGSNIGADGKVEYASASLRNGAYREGKITIDGKPRHVFLLDYNNNGRFDDLCEMNDNIRMADGRLYPDIGDMVLVDPRFKKEMYSGYSPVDSADRQYLSKLVGIEGRYYRITTSAAGDKVTIDPASLPLGAIASDNGPYRAVLFGTHGMIKIAGEKGKPAPVPAGEWQLLEYQINLTNAPAEKPKSQPATSEKKTPEQAEAGKPAPAKKKSLGERLAGLFGAGSYAPPIAAVVGPKYTFVQARATEKPKPLKVAEGKTETLVFGPPYKPVVSVGWVNPGSKDVSLQLKLVGVAGEVCETIMVKGAQPGAPTFRILKKDGELVKKGQFEYG